MFVVFIFFTNNIYAENIAVNKTATTPSDATASGSAPTNAIDGNEATYWATTASYKKQLFIDLGKRYNISKICMKWNGIFFPTSLDILYSDTPITSTNVDNVSKISYDGYNNVGPGPVSNVFDALNISARYVGVQTKGRNNTGGYTADHYELNEFEVSGVEDISYVPTPTNDGQTAIDLITNRLIAKYLTSYTSDVTPTTLFQSMNADGTWTDVNYNDKISIGGWAPATHLSRLQTMAVAFRTPSSTWFQNVEMQTKIETGLLYYKSKNPIATDNWWYTDIGDPQIYMIPAILLKGYSSNEKMLQISGYLKNQVTRFAGGGQNLAWIAEITAYKGCMENNLSTVEQAFEGMASILSIVSTQGDEGIKIDGSFHQHHEQIYSGGYGLSLTTYLSSFLELASGTLFYDVFTPERIEIFRNMLLNGHRLLGYRSVMDFGTIGRNISRSGSGANISSTVLDQMIVADTLKAADYKAWKAHLSGASFPAVGNKQFWKSDIMTQHGENYYMSAKIISKRTLGTECLNTENLLGYNLPMGATNILTYGTEYKGIYPSWDWNKIPGVTSAQDADAAKLDGYIYGTNEFGGGVSNGISGIIAYEHNYKSVQAYKAYFMFDDAMVCLGSNINSTKTSEIATSVNQCFLKGDVTLSHGDTIETMVEKTSIGLNNLKWIHHGNVGYIFPKSESITVRNQLQTGTWGTINGTGGSSPIRNYVFSTWISHGVIPSGSDYQYIVVPDKSLANFEQFVQNNGFVIIRNDDKVQAIRNDISGKVGIVFHSGETIDVRNGLTVTSDKAALILIEQNGVNYKISVADPKYKEVSIQVTLNKKLSGTNATVYDNNTSILFNLPSGDYLGSTITNDYADLNPNLINQLSINADVVLFPNPAKTKTTIYFEKAKFSSVELYSLDGRMISKKIIASTDAKVDIPLDKYQVGTYLLKLSGNSNTTIKKLIIL